jgi:hypothetical protein
LKSNATVSSVTNRTSEFRTGDLWLIFDWAITGFFALGVDTIVVASHLMGLFGDRSLVATLGERSLLNIMIIRCNCTESQAWV